MSERKFKIASDDQRLVWGEVYIPNVPDTDDEFMDAQTIQKMAYNFMRNLRLKSVDSHHNNELVEGACVVESFIARKGDPDFAEGAWVVCSHVHNDKTWAAIKKGELNGYSIEASVLKRAAVLEMDIPPVLTGMTQKADTDAHEHTFNISYDEAGSFVGGRTDVVKNHYHEIKRGTTTEPGSDGSPAHRFAYVEMLSRSSTVVKVEKVDVSGADLETVGKKSPEQGGGKRKRKGSLASYIRC